MHLETTISLELDSTELEDSSLELETIGVSLELETTGSSLELDSGSEELDSGSIELEETGVSLELDSGSTLELETSSMQGVSDHHHV